jgi:nucleotide-binding universal stress UspA family protein
MFTRLLVPLDGSPLAEEAIPHAELFAHIFGANIILLQVLEPASFHENTEAVDPLKWEIRKAEADMYLHGIASRVRENLGEKPLPGEDEKKSRVDYALREGKTAENIVDFAHAENIDLLVISTHGSSGLSRWNISSITQKVISQVYLSVLLVRAYDRSRADERLSRYRRILLPIDSSRRAECALPAGIQLARSEMPTSNKPGEAGDKTRLILAAVIRPPEVPIPEPAPVEISQLTDQLLQVSRQAVKKYFDEMKERMPVECDTRVVESAGVASAIQELADQEDIDMVVLCAHGYSGKVHRPYGTVARNYIEHGTKPVLVIQDVPLSQVRPTAAELAAEKSGRR